MSSGEQGLQNLEHPVFVQFFKEAESLMASGKARGFGEIHINNRNNVNSSDPFGRSIPLDSPVVRRMYEISDAYVLGCVSALARQIRTKRRWWLAICTTRVVMKIRHSYATEHSNY